MRESLRCGALDSFIPRKETRIVDCEVNAPDIAVNAVV